MGVPPVAAVVADGIVTPEAVVLEFGTAGLPSRALAFVFDVAIHGAVLLILVGSLGLVFARLVNETVAVVIAIAAGFGVLLAYPVFWETLFDGRSPGKMVVGLRVITVEGGPVRVRHAAIRSALGMVDFLASAGSLAVVSVLLSRQSQRLGDLAAGTIVIRDRPSAAMATAIDFLPRPGWEDSARRLEVRALSEETAVLVRAFLLRSRDLSAAARAQVAARLAETVATTIRAPLPEGTDMEAFLIAVVAAHQARGGTSRVGATGPVAAPPPMRRTVPRRVIIDAAPSETWGTP